MRVAAPNTAYPILVRNNWEWKIPFSSLLYMLVRWITQSNYNHVVLAWDTGSGILIVESKGAGVVATDLELWLNSRKRELKPLLTTCNAENFIPHIGKRYDRASFTFYYAYFILTGKWIGKTGYQAQQMLTCSELVALSYKLPNPWLWMPGDLEKHFSTYAVNR